MAHQLVTFFHLLCSRLQHTSNTKNSPFADAYMVLETKYKEATSRLMDYENQKVLSAHEPALVPGSSAAEEQLRQRLEAVSQSYASSQEQLMEMRSRLDTKTMECQQLCAKVSQLENSLGLANLRITQVGLVFI